jgi:hypothetical protein
MTQIAQRAIARSTAKRQQHHIGAQISVSVFGRMVDATIIAVHPFGTVDVKFDNGNYARVSGLSLDERTSK